jgi:hypothetical protein
MKNTLTRLTILVCLLAISACAQKKKDTICSIRIERDSIFVDGAIRDSKTFGIPVSFRVDPPVKYDYSDAEQFRQDRLKNPRRVCLQFTERINSYDIQVVLHPDDDIDSVGMAEWTFTRGRNSICIETGFSWNWQEDIKRQVKDSILYEGEIYTIAPWPEMLQGQDSVIRDTPFCFKDVDFDGKPEFCFRGHGWNRYYFNAYKLISSSNAKLMTGHPYNNLVNPNGEACSTEFDYANKTIHLFEVHGSSVYDHWYKKRPVVHNVLDPMQHISGVESNYSGLYRNDDYFENGRMVKSHIEYELDMIDGFAYDEIVAEYVAVDERNFSLQTLKLHDCDNEIWQDLYDKEKSIQL